MKAVMGWLGYGHWVWGGLEHYAIERRELRVFNNRYFSLAPSQRIPEVLRLADKFDG